MKDVSDRLPKCTHRSTIFRWAQRGLHGIKLKVVTVGNTKCTTESWLILFFEAVEAAQQSGVAREPSRRRRTSRGNSNTTRKPWTEEILRRHGLNEAN
ncbi:MAG: DUF1580 domain-containing protein [Planctomycetes bacterium]|nr:DUF1580 domain-containing protein [Planctomycetota bacterium]